MENKSKAALFSSGITMLFLILSIFIAWLIQADPVITKWNPEFRAWWFGLSGVIAFFIFLITYHENI